MFGGDPRVGLDRGRSSGRWCHTWRPRPVKRDDAHDFARQDRAMTAMTAMTEGSAAMAGLSVLVTGGTGTLGRRLVPRLKAAGCAVRVLTRQARTDEDGVRYLVGDLAGGGRRRDHRALRGCQQG